MDKSRKTVLKDKLLEEKRRLWNELREEVFKRLGEDYHSQFETSMDIEDVALIDLIEEVGLSIAEIKKDRLTLIEEALRKIEDGRYGICEECGGEIDESRLSVTPFAIYCVRCKSAKEGP